MEKSYGTSTKQCKVITYVEHKKKKKMKENNEMSCL